MLYIKALHIIFVVTWFAGLFYIVRLFVYHVEAMRLHDQAAGQILMKQYTIMMRRLWYGITWPSAVLTVIFGCWLLSFYSTIPLWLWFKLGLVLLLFVYHILCHFIFLQCLRGTVKFTSTQLRLWNEVATVFLIGIVFLVVLKQALEAWYALLGMLLLSVMLFVSIYIYKKIRTNRMA